MQNNRNFYITIALSILILALWQVFYMNPKIEAQREVQRVEQERLLKEQAAKGAAPAAGSPGAAATTGSARADDAGSRRRREPDPRSGAGADQARRD